MILIERAPEYVIEDPLILVIQRGRLVDDSYFEITIEARDWGHMKNHREIQRFIKDPEFVCFSISLPDEDAHPSERTYLMYEMQTDFYPVGFLNKDIKELDRFDVKTAQSRCDANKQAKINERTIKIFED